MLSLLGQALGFLMFFCDADLMVFCFENRYIKGALKNHKLFFSGAVFAGKLVWN